MKLTKDQVSALASQFVREHNAAYDKEEKRRTADARKKWDASPDGKLYAKLPNWMKESIRGYNVDSQVAKLRDNANMPTKVNQDQVREHILVASIGLDDAEAIMDALKRKFSK
jgi:hypothetical protein